MRELAERLRAEITPSTLPAVAMIGVFVYWAAGEAGYPLRDWMPGALFALALLAVTLAVGRLRVRELPIPLIVAGIALIAFTAWTFLSISWADSKGDAWDGANRTMLYLVVFLLFALWRQHGLSAGLLLALWVVAMMVLGTITLFDLRDDPAGGFYEGFRLIEPAGYVNAAAATWLMVVFPALALASRAEAPWWIRGPLAGGIVVLSALALLSQSRGSLFAAPVALVVYFLLVQLACAR